MNIINDKIEALGNAAGFTDIYVNQKVSPYMESQYKYQYYVFCNPGDIALSGSWLVSSNMRMGDNVHMSADRVSGGDRYFVELTTDEPIYVSANVIVEVVCMDVTP